MAFTYDPTHLDDTPLFQVRFRLGDTVETSATFQDEEINYALGVNNNNVIKTCIDCISTILPRLAQTSGFKVGPYEEKESSRGYEYWHTLLAELKAKLCVYSAPMINEPMGPHIFYYGMQSTQDSEACYDP